MKYYIVYEIEAKNVNEALRKRTKKLLAVVPEQLKPPKQLSDAIGFVWDKPEDDDNEYE